MGRKNVKATTSGKLIATRPILYEGRQFMAGEALPCHDSAMVKAWEEAGSAKREEEKKNEVKTQKPEQKPEAGENEEIKTQKPEAGENEEIKTQKPEAGEDEK